MSEIEIINTPEGAPVICLPGGQTSPGCLSISHSGALAFCAMTQAAALKIGVDLEKVEPRSVDFVKDYLTQTEQRLVASYLPEHQETSVTLIWSMKEAMLKALGVGLRWDTRQVEIWKIDGLRAGGESPTAWEEIRVRDAQTENRPWTAWWQRRGDFILTIAGYASHPGPVSVKLVEKQL